MRANTKLSRVTQLSGLGAIGALCLAVFFHGPQVPLLAGAQSLLIAWLTLSLGSRHSQGIRLPLTPISISLTLFWAWLGVSIAWSSVPTTSIFTFWWVASLPLAFWCYTLSPDHDRIWLYLTRFVVGGGLLLSTFAMVQLFAWGELPRSTFVNIHSFAALIVLIALPLSAHFIANLEKRTKAETIYGLGTILGFFFFTVFITDGRGTSLSLALGVVTLAALSARHVGLRAISVLVGLLSVMFIAANLALRGRVSGNRLGTLIDPASAGYDRLLIWGGSWKMLTNDPWWGIGLGTYYLRWPPYRHPADQTLGFFVHNDYLQIWIEAGLPALLLLLGIFAGVLFLLVRFLRRKRVGAEQRSELVGLFCGLFAVALHSFFDFNFYILPTSILAGLMLGRFHQLVTDAKRDRMLVLKPARAMQVHAYMTIVALLALFPIAYLAASGISDHLYRRGFAFALEGQLQQADKAFARAERLLPSDDKILLMHADLYRHALGQLPKTAESDRRALYETALTMLDEAQTANPYRPLIDTVRGHMFEENRDLAGAEWFAKAEAAYTRALTLNPRFFGPRMRYASLLLEQGRERDAYRVLEDGMLYWYYPENEVLAYYQLTARLARNQRNEARVSEIEHQISQLRQDIANRATVRPVMPQLNAPATPSAT